MDADGVTASSSPNAAEEGVNNYKKDGDELYERVWRACAGECVYIPRVGDKVLYFPQGYLEQVASFTQHQQDGHADIPVHNLPSKILCRVVSVQLKIEASRDEVFAQVTLLPESKQDELSSKDTDTAQIPSRSSVYSFSKILTSSDSGAHGGFSIPKRHAYECFPPLDMTLKPPAQELVARDLHGYDWRFRHIFRGQPRRNLLTSGWSTFLNSKKLAAGDTCIFFRGENGELRIGVRRAMKRQNIASPSASLISAHSMQLGILVSASNAVATGSMFTVYHYPRTNPFEFIIPLQRYMKSTQMSYATGMRVQLLLDVEEPRKRYAGTVISIEDFDGIRWPGSEWRSLKVQWDATPHADMHPERVCPWWIEALDCAKQKHIPILPAPKKARPNNLPLPELSGFVKDETIRYSAKPAAQRLERDLQGQDYNDVASPQPVLKQPSSKVICNSNLGIENQLRIPIQDPVHQCTGSSMSFPHEDLSTSSSNAYCPGSESQGWPSSESKDENDVPFGPHSSCTTYKLFGIYLTDCQSELPSPQFSAYSKIPSTISIPPMSHSSIYATIQAAKQCGNIQGVSSEKRCKKCRSDNSRSCTKVLKQGTALGRAIDLTRFAGYDELISELDWMFDFGGGLINGSSGWHVTCIDEDGDIMLLGDFPWQDFRSMVQKMIIRPKDAINNPSPSSSAYPASI
ncbi:auxin response factor 4-like isoform X1 [Arachis stenosperma]|uniref:auxin response factor 4-like isoform X1 n=1 Tax=Arachis stenosperma TaxID=217475 RepID=UPI0025AC4BC2|nr:auxin response factor 4-like isoform X1 [Arachis stenosperma]